MAIPFNRIFQQIKDNLPKTKFMPTCVPRLYLTQVRARFVPSPTIFATLECWATFGQIAEIAQEFLRALSD